MLMQDIRKRKTKIGHRTIPEQDARSISCGKYHVNAAYTLERINGIIHASVLHHPRVMSVYMPATNHTNDSAVIRPIPRMKRKVLMSKALAEERSQVEHLKPRYINIDNRELPGRNGTYWKEGSRSQEYTARSYIQKMASRVQAMGRL